MTLEYIGGWGDRSESLRESAERMQRSWQAFPQQREIYTQWSMQSYPDGILHLQPVPSGDLDAIIDAGRLATERVNDGPRTAPGFNLEFVRDCVGASASKAEVTLFSYNVRSGFAGPRALRNHLFMELDPSLGSPPDERTVIRGYLEAMVKAWAPEHVSVCTYAFHKAQRCKTPQVRVGWLTYIRDTVPLDRDVLTEGVRVDIGDEGRYFTLSGSPQEPHLEEALSIRRALGYSS